MSPRNSLVSRSDSLPNILLVVLDSVRARNTGIHGGHDTTPFLEQFAQSATMYEQARAPSIHSISSHVSLFTGHHVDEHRCVSHGSAINTRETIWAELQADYGYRTGLFTPNRVVADASNLRECFQTAKTEEFSVQNRPKEIFPSAYSPFDSKKSETVLEHIKSSLSDDQPFRSFANCAWDVGTSLEDRIRPSPAHKEVSGDVYVEKFLKWEREQDDPWAACINLMDPHYPYVPEEEYDRWAMPELHTLQNKMPTGAKSVLQDQRWWSVLRAIEPLYDGAIYQSDAIVRKLIDELKKRDALDNTLVVITSDHGEGFGERSLVEPRARMAGHKWGIHEVLTHVPLLVKRPHQVEAKAISSVATLTRFPSVVRSCISGDNTTDPFVDDGFALSMTYLLDERHRDKYDFYSDIDVLIGPWRAVYENNGNAVRKSVCKGNRSATIDIFDANTAVHINENGKDTVEHRYSKLADTELVYEEEKRFSDELEQRLQNLGYIR